MLKPFRPAWWEAHRTDLWALSVIIVFFAAFFYPVVFGGKFFVINDAFVELYPLRSVMWDEIRHGRLPLWTPLIMAGYPILSMAQNAIGYPLTWGYLFLPGRWAEQIYTLSPYLLAPTFVYAYCREMRRSRLAALLAGLTFGYGGLMVSAVANNGLLPNAIVWLPLMLIAIDRSRKRAFVPCLLGATGAYSMSVLSGVGQGFLYVGLIAIAYALFLTLVANSLIDAGSDNGELPNRKRWQPLAVSAGAIVLSAGVAAFQILETMRAARHSIRSVLAYEAFTIGSYTFEDTLRTFLTPLHHIVHATAYVAPLSAAMAIWVLTRVFREPRRDARIFFWFGLAVAAWVLMMGANTPLYLLLYQIPLVNSFRVPPRHAFEWSFALGILAAYGWDSPGSFFSRTSETLSGLPWKKIAAGLLLLALGVVVFIYWHIAANQTRAVWNESNRYPKSPESVYLLCKIVLTLVTFAVVWLGWRITSRRWRQFLLTGAIALSCFAEPSIMASRWWWPALKKADRFTTFSQATKFMETQAPQENRIYIRAVPWLEEMNEQPRIDAGNLTMLRRLRNAGGYEPLILESYSRALGNVGMDAANPRQGSATDQTLFEPRCRVLDLLNTAFVASYQDLLTEPTLPLVKDGIRFQNLDLLRALKPGEKEEIVGVAHEADTLGIVSSLAYSVAEADGSTIARLRLFASDGHIIERELRAGVETAEWAHERPDVRAIVLHQLAPVFDSFPGDESNGFTAHRYWARVPLAGRVRVEWIEIENISPRATLALNKMTLYDSFTQYSMPLPHYDLNRWQRVYEKDGVEIIRNKQVLPRLWLVAEAEAVDGEEALRRIRGESKTPFDPRRTALLEVLPNEVPTLPGGMISLDATARLVVAEPNRLVVDATSPTPSVLVVSEVNYPGWTAIVDGHPTPILATDFLLRGVALTSGTHRVEMHYSAPAARNGALISLLTLLLIGGLVVYPRVMRSRS